MLCPDYLCIPETTEKALSHSRRLQLLCQALPGLSFSSPLDHVKPRPLPCANTLSCRGTDCDKDTDRTKDSEFFAKESNPIGMIPEPENKPALALTNNNVLIPPVLPRYTAATTDLPFKSQPYVSSGFSRLGVGPNLFPQKASIQSPQQSSVDWNESSVPDLYESDIEWPDLSRWTKSRTNSSSTEDSVGSTLLTPTVSYSDFPSQFGTSLLDTTSSTTEKDPVIFKWRSNSSGSLKKIDLLAPSTQLPPAPELESSAKSQNQSKPSKPELNALHPAKTGFALWVGNLGPRTTLADLCQLFGTPELQSIYLIQRTGCAFVNYADKAALENGVRLFEQRGGRLHDHDLVTKIQIGDGTDKVPGSPGSQCTCGQDAPPTSADGSENRYFICKSLTIEDLELAKKQGEWSTQLRNKDRLNKAFHTSKHTFLVFSANRTSAFYGIARLDSEFTDQSAADHENSAAHGKTQIEDSTPPEITPTEAYAHPDDGTLIPAGESVLDPLRGSQFWKVSGCACVEPEVEKWTAPAKITWLSPPNGIVPFCRTRQMKNSLNANKPIKVARDGTEIDPAVGFQLCQMFNA